jgi:hypothetical protein
VIVLDSAGYGPFTITQSVSITAPPGIYAGVSVFSGDGIDINAGSFDKVSLRGLTVNNQGGTGSGIVFTTGGLLHMEGCVANGFPNAGVLAQGTGNLEAKDCVFKSNNNGINVHPVSGNARATVDQVRLEGNTTGLRADAGSLVTVRNSVASSNGFGFICSSVTSAAAEMNIESCVASNNLMSGVEVDSGSTGVALARVSNSIVTDNQSGLVNQGSPAVLLSRGNNTVEGNSFNTGGTIGSYTAR